ncbi:MAG TPA: 3-oxoacyl-[acyl-carrier-protein] synthase III C-terminal domain-containing protein [Candidatus Thermoplasmatota archaeon]|nr:3-oxoacyl-[acyl-carrier-protein] synthase III C-terminal domain-containing protein [Candidatus Thermoplasmatota archaeon]
MASLLSVATATPPNRLPQSELRAVAEALLPDSPGKAGILEVFDNARIDARSLAMPVEWYLRPHGFRDRTEAYLRVGLELIEQASRAALEQAGLGAQQVKGIVLVSTTGMATPSLDARLMNRIPFAPSTVRMPLWGLGCAGGVAGLSRGFELAGSRQGPVLVVAMDLCTLLFDVQRALEPGDGGPDKKALVAASLFGDGCAAAVVGPGPGGLARHLASASHLFPATERVMGWDVEDHNLDVVLSPRIPDIVRTHAKSLLQPLLDQHGTPHDWVLHPGGAKVVDAYRAALSLTGHDLRHTEAVLRAHGNMSSPTVLFALQQALAAGALREGRTALLAALGPGFASEIAVLQG